MVTAGSPFRAGRGLVVGLEAEQLTTRLASQHLFTSCLDKEARIRTACAPLPVCTRDSFVRQGPAKELSFYAFSRRDLLRILPPGTTPF